MGNKRMKLSDIVKIKSELKGYQFLEHSFLEDYDKDKQSLFDNEDIFKVLGKKEYSLRYDLTSPLRTYVIDNINDIVLPLKRISNGKVFRDDKPDKGRFKEFEQVDLDIIGFSNSKAIHELITILSDSLTEYGVSDFKIVYNDRKLIPYSDKTILRILDKYRKLGESKTIELLINEGFNGLEIIDTVENINYPSNVSESYVFDPFMVRGMDYYTGFIFEIQYEGFTIGGGGQYDNFIKKGLTSFGGSLGVTRIESLIETDYESNVVGILNLSEKFWPQIEKVQKCLNIQGVKADIYMGESKKLSKQLKWADKKNFSKVYIIGEEEFENETIMIKDMKSIKKRSENAKTRDDWLKSDLSTSLPIKELEGYKDV